MVSHNGHLLLEEHDYELLSEEDVRFDFELRGPRNGKSGDMVAIIDTDENKKLAFEVLRKIEKGGRIPDDARKVLIRRL